MIIVAEREIAGLIGPQECFVAVEQVFAAMAGRAASNLPANISRLRPKPRHEARQESIRECWERRYSN